MNINTQKLKLEIAKSVLKLRELKSVTRRPHRTSEGEFIKSELPYNNIKDIAPEFQCRIVAQKTQGDNFTSLFSKSRGRIHFVNQDVSFQDELLEKHKAFIEDLCGDKNE